MSLAKDSVFEVYDSLGEAIELAIVTTLLINFPIYCAMSADFRRGYEIFNYDHILSASASASTPAHDT